MSYLTSRHPMMTSDGSDSSVKEKMTENLMMCESKDTSVK